MPLDEMKFKELLESIAAKTPTPGGGAVAAITAALGAALAQMVLNYSTGKKSLANHETANRAALQNLIDAGNSSLQLAEQDAIAYARMNELWKLNETDARRQQDMPAAIEGAIDPPRRLLEMCIETLHLLRALVGTTNPHLKSDLAIAAILTEAAARSAAWNVRINLPLLPDADQKHALEAALPERLATAGRIANEIQVACEAPS